MPALHDRLDAGSGECVVPAAMVEIEVGGDQQVDAIRSDPELSQAGDDVVLGTSDVGVRPPRLAAGGADHRRRVAAIDQDDAARCGADEVARDLVELHLTVLILGAEGPEVQQIELVHRHTSDLVVVGAALAAAGTIDAVSGLRLSLKWAMSRAKSWP